MSRFSFRKAPVSEPALETPEPAADGALVPASAETAVPAAVARPFRVKP